VLDYADIRRIIATSARALQERFSRSQRLCTDVNIEGDAREMDSGRRLPWSAPEDGRRHDDRRSCLPPPVDVAEKRLQCGHVCHGDGHQVQIGNRDVVTHQGCRRARAMPSAAPACAVARRDADDGWDRPADPRKIEVGMDFAYDARVLQVLVALSRRSGRKGGRLGQTRCTVPRAPKSHA